MTSRMMFYFCVTKMSGAIKENWKEWVVLCTLSAKKKNFATFYLLQRLSVAVQRGNCALINGCIG